MSASGNSTAANKSGSGGGSSAGRRSHAEATQLRRLCVFVDGGQRYALDVSLVGEVFVAERVAVVARAPAPVLGVFNCRGTPVPMVDLGAALGLVRAPAPLGDGPTWTVLLVRRGPLAAGIRVDRVESVVDVDALMPPDERVEAHVEGLLEDGAGTPVQALSAKFFVERLRALRIRPQ